MATVGGDRGEVGAIHDEELTAHGEDFRVKLHAGHLYIRPVDVGIEAAHRARGRTDNQQAGGRRLRCRLRPEERGEQEIVPNAVTQHGVGVVDAVNADAVVQLEMALAAPLAHGNVVEAALILENDGATAAVVPAGAYGAIASAPQGECGHKQQRSQRQPHVAFPDCANEQNNEERERERKEGEPRANCRNQQDHGHKCAQQAAHGAHGVETADACARMGIVWRASAEQQAHSPGARRSQQYYRHAEEKQDGRERAAEQAGCKAFESCGRQTQHGAAEKGDERDTHGCESQHAVEYRAARVAVGQAAAQPRAQRQIEQDHADECGPHYLVRAECRLEQARGA